MLVVMVVMRVRTGLVGGLSTSGLAGMAAAGLCVAQLDPVVAQKQPQLATERHRLSQIGQEEGASRSRHDPKVSNLVLLVKGS
jgi:hypothetical protein